MNCSFQRHKKYECNREPTMYCNFCPHTTKYRHDLKKHIQQKHKYLPPDDPKYNLLYVG